MASTHSILTISDKNKKIYIEKSELTDDEYYDDYQKGYIGNTDANGVLRIYSGAPLNSGYYFYIVSTIEEKIYYAISALCGAQVNKEGIISDFRSKEEISENLKKILEIINKEYKEDLRMPAQSIRFGSEFVQIGPRYEIVDEYKGIIADDSKYLLENFLKEKDITLAEFIESPCYIVITDVIGNKVFNEYQKLGIIDADVIMDTFRNGETKW